MKAINFFGLLLLFQCLFAAYILGRYAYIHRQHQTVANYVILHLQQNMERCRKIMQKTIEAEHQYHYNFNVKDSRGLDYYQLLMLSHRLHEKWYRYWQLPNFYEQSADSLEGYKAQLTELIDERYKGEYPTQLVNWEPKRWVGNFSPYAEIQKEVWLLETKHREYEIGHAVFSIGCRLEMYNKEFTPYISLPQQEILQNDTLHAKIGIKKGGGTWRIPTCSVAGKQIPVTADGFGNYKILCNDTGIFSMKGVFAFPSDSDVSINRYPFTINYRVIEPCH